jgi:hypothetical protein
MIGWETESKECRHEATELPSALSLGFRTLYVAMRNV